MGRQRNSRIGLYFFLTAAALVLVVLLVVLLPGEDAGAQEMEAAILEGVQYLQSLEQKDPADVEAALKAIRQQELEAERQKRMNDLLSGQVDVWSQFQDYVILGDSRAVGFWYYGFLPEARVLSAGGATIRDVAGWMSDIQALNPSYIFLCFGLNDVSIGFWHSPEEYAAEYLEVITTLRQAVPGATVYVSSILPARDPAFERASIWREIPTYSRVLGEMCQENGIPFVDNDQISEDHADLWETDGIHVRKEFYSYWGVNLLMAVYEDGQEE